MMPLKLNNLKALPHLRDLRTIARSRIFDSNWYLAEYPACTAHGLLPIIHYLLEGARQGARPHLLFNPAWYLQSRGKALRNPNPLLDYIQYGALEGIDPSPYFSSRYYRQTAGDLCGLTPLGHFTAHGLSGGATPTPLFDRAFYLENNPDVREAGFDPFLHFVASGARDGRSPGPLFDAAWYRMTNAEMCDGGYEPLAHYLAVGSARGQNPSPFFDAAFYVAQAGDPPVTLANALIDYAERGRYQWRSTHPNLPPPASPAAYFEAFPWRQSSAPREACEAPFRVVIVDIGAGGKERPSPDTLLAALEKLPQLDVYVLTDTGGWMSERVYELDLSVPEFSALDKSVVLDRMLRALKFRDPRALVIEAACALPLDDVCAGIGLRHCQRDAASGGEEWASLLRREIGYCAAPRPTLSVIIPNYNHARYLDERFRSIFAQRLMPDEIIFLDDCSSDDSLSIAKTWRAKTKLPFGIERNETNSGSPFSQWAKGISRATCDLVWIAESDDACDPRFLERVSASFIDPDVVLAYCDSKVIGTSGQLLAETYRFYTDTLNDTKWLSGYVEDGFAEITTALSIKNTIPNVSAALFRRTALEAALPAMQSFRYCGDWATYVDCLKQGKIAYCPQALNRHRQDSQSVTQEGEHSIRAVTEALAIKSAIFAKLNPPPPTGVLSLAQTLFEYELRSTSSQNRPRFIENEDLRASIEQFSSLIPAGSGDLQQSFGFLERLAASSPKLDKICRIAIVNRVIAQLETLWNPKSSVA